MCETRLSMIIIGMKFQNSLLIAKLASFQSDYPMLSRSFDFLRVS